MPSAEWFEEQPSEYRARVPPPSVRARVAFGAGIGPTWYRYVGDHGRIVSPPHFGASADAETLFAASGLTSEHVVAAARESLAAVRG
jgi:transketolase